jgi:sugar/nucleoside kinase (ribokinase family)
MVNQWSYFNFITVLFKTMNNKKISVEEINKKFDVIGIGNAIVDVIANVNDDFLEMHSLDKGTMRLIEERDVLKLKSGINTVRIISGGSAANTIAGLAVLGNKTAFIGKIKDDDFGNAFEQELKKLGVFFNTAKACSVDAPSTASCIVLTTPDAQRTMNTCLGIAGSIAPEDIDENIIAQSKMLYIEGYLWDKDSAKSAIRKAIALAEKSSTIIVMSLSDKFCVDRNRDEFFDIINQDAGLVFANEIEIMSLFETESFEKTVECCKKLSCIFAITRGEKGSCIISTGEIISVDAVIAGVIDSTGAGDMYAAGFINGRLLGRDLHTCGRMGSILAAEIISHYGARPEKPLLELLAQEGL